MLHLRAHVGKSELKIRLNCSHQLSLPARRILRTPAWMMRAPQRQQPVSQAICKPTSSSACWRFTAPTRMRKPERQHRRKRAAHAAPDGFLPETAPAAPRCPPAGCRASERCN